MNRVLLSGRISSEKIREFRSENSLCVQFNIAAISDSKKGTEFIDISIFNKVAENFLKYCKKGDLIEVEGRIDNSPYTTKTGEKKYKLDVIGSKITYLVKSLQNEQDRTKVKNSSEDKKGSDLVVDYYIDEGEDNE